MKITMLAAISNDGFIADRNGEVASWTSELDKDFFDQKLQQADLCIMGSGTYDAIQPAPTTDRLQVVLTSEPERYIEQVVTDQLHFENLPIPELLNKYKNYRNALLLGGSVVYELFLRRHKVSEAYITLERNVQLQSGTPLLESGRCFEDVAHILMHTELPQSTPETRITRYMLHSVGLPKTKALRS